MKPLWIVSPVLAGILAISTPLSFPLPLLAHVGHGDEFQAEGGINRVQVNPETDSVLGIQVTPIEPAVDGSAAVLIPVTAVVDADGKQIVFVQYENFYEPVPVNTGATQGELIEVTQGLAIGEKLVTQGSLSLYAESRKTQTATASPQPDATHAQADAQGIPHSHDSTGNLVPPSDVAQQPPEATQSTKGFPIGMVATIGGGAVLLVGAMAVLGGGRKKKSTFSNKKGGY